MVALGAVSIGGAPPLGRILDPANGVWAVARTAELPRSANDRVPGLGARVEVRYDQRGVPHIFASSETDAYRALGYVVARERLFQIEVQVRAGAGTLTDLVGGAALPADRETRSLGLPRAAERAFARLDTTTPGGRAIRAYAEGVNAWISHLARAGVPIEYRLLHRTPALWKPIDAYHLLNRMSRTLSYAPLELTRLKVTRRFGDSVARALFPVHSPLQQPIVPTKDRTLRLRAGRLPPPPAPLESVDQRTANAGRSADAPDSLMGEASAQTQERGALGSNNWAVSPLRTKSGYALLAGDPHLDLTLPSIWYEVHLVVPGQLDVAGVTIPGGPGVIIGFTPDVAWTFTNTGSDALDFYDETVDDSARPTRYRVDGAWRPVESRIETYRGPGGDVLAVDTVRYTHRGPLHRVGGRWMSMRWTALEAGAALNALLAGAHTHSVREWLAAAASYDVPAQNILLADRGGHIGIRSIGRYPLRPGDGRGDLVRDGSKSANDWRGDLSVDRYPTAIDPPQGYLASANQEPIDPDAPGPARDTYLGADWEPPWRAARINQLLASDFSATPDDMREWQTDAGSARADYFVPYFLDAARRTDSAGRGAPEVRDAAHLLAQWDRRYTRDNERAVLFEAAMRELSARAWSRLADSASGGLRAVPSDAVLVELLHDPTSRWWDDPRTPRVEQRDEVVAASLAAGLERVRSRYGEPSSGGWRWDRIRHENVYHLLQVPAFSRLALPMQGGKETLNPSSGDGVEGASWRMVVELGPTVRAWATYPGGQSGNPVSSQYADRLPQWLAGTLDSVRTPHSVADLSSADVRATLTLEPAP